MLIDWFTVGAQALNFLALVWLLKRFLYKPVLNAIDAREKRVAAELAGADAAKAEARADRETFQRKNEVFDHERATLLAKATDDAKAEGRRLSDEAARAAEATAAKRRDAVRAEADGLRKAVGLRTEQEVFAIARKTLADLAAAPLEEQIVGVFTRRLGEMDGGEKKLLGEAIHTGRDAATVRTAFDVPAGPRAAIQNAVNVTFAADVHLGFETAPDLIAGIELSAGGQKLAWSITSYLASLQSGVDEILDGRQNGSQAKQVAAKPAVIAKAG